MKQLDLGCGTLPAFQQHSIEGYEHFGVDIIDQDLPGVSRADLTIERIPFADDTFDLVTAHEFFEHIPKIIYVPGLRAITPVSDIMEKGATYELPMQRRNCIIELFNEIYRVMKDGAELRFDVPIAGTTQYYGDPTHVSEWTADSINYYCGDYFGYHDDYGHKTKFKKIACSTDPHRDWRLEAILQAVKPMEPPYEP